METMKIPVDRSQPEEIRPIITSDMKAACIGEFDINLPTFCPDCYQHEGEADPECTICKGQGEYIRKINIPWTVMKDIYKRMATVAARECDQ